MIASEARQRGYEGIHCTLTLQQPAPTVIVLRITGTDVGEFGQGPMKTLDDWLVGSDQIDFFIDARDGRGVSIAVSAEWAQWLGNNKARLKAITMLTGSRMIQITAEFVRRFSALEGMMWICTQDEVFDGALQNSLRSDSAGG
ncbi:MAG TPA: hypothetical protein VGL82_01645 [Bryobacteraceae bacterium]|jgi:hypothetical protein